MLYSTTLSRVGISFKGLNVISLLEHVETRSYSIIPDSVVIERSLCH